MSADVIRLESIGLTGVVSDAAEAKFQHFSLLDKDSRKRGHPFRAPIVTPLKNHFWSQRNTIKIGIIQIIMEAVNMLYGTIYCPPAIFEITTGRGFN